MLAMILPNYQDGNDIAENCTLRLTDFSYYRVDTTIIHKSDTNLKENRRPLIPLEDFGSQKTFVKYLFVLILEYLEP